MVRYLAATLTALVGVAFAWVDVAGRGLDRWALIGARYLGSERAAAPAAAPQAASAGVTEPVPQRLISAPASEPVAPRAAKPSALATLVALARRGLGALPRGSARPVARHPVVWSGTRVVAVVGLSGGAGRTEVVARLGRLLARGARVWSSDGGERPLRVAALDWDLRSGDLALRLGLEGDCPLEAPAFRPELLPSMLRQHRCGLACQPGPGSSYESDHERVRAAAGMVPGMLAALAETGFDLVLIDCAAGVDPLVRALTTQADDLLYVLPATPGGIQDAYRAAEAFRRLGAGRRLRLLTTLVRSPWPQQRLLDDLGWSDWGTLGEVAPGSRLNSSESQAAWTALARRLLPGFAHEAMGDAAPSHGLRPEAPSPLGAA